jgi:hypothetical protein
MVSTDLRHPDLRLRDIKRILAAKRLDITWDPGTAADSMWVYATFEDGDHRQRFLDWLSSKRISPSAEALLLVDGCYESASVTWGDILAHPEKFFGERSIKIISRDVDWRLDYRQGCVARFGRWKSPVHVHLTNR